MMISDRTTNLPISGAKRVADGLGLKSLSHLTGAVPRTE